MVEDSGRMESSNVAEHEVSTPSDAESDDTPEPEPADTRRVRPTKTSLQLSIVALVVSVLGLAASGYQAYIGAGQLRAAEASLTEARSLFDAAGPVLRVTTQVSTLDPKMTVGTGNPTKRYFPEGSMPVLTEQAARSGRTSQFLYVVLQNTGREATTITEVAFDVAQPSSPLVKASNVPGPRSVQSTFCEIKLSGGTPCSTRLPYVIEPGRQLVVALAMNLWYTSMKARTCSTGTRIEIEAVGVRNSPLAYVSPARAC